MPVALAIEFEPPLEELDLSPLGPAASVEDVLHTWGGIYLGDWQQDRPHGRGTLQLRNGQVVFLSLIRLNKSNCARFVCLFSSNSSTRAISFRVASITTHLQILPTLECNRRES